MILYLMLSESTAEQLSCHVAYTDFLKDWTDAGHKIIEKSPILDSEDLNTGNHTLILSDRPEVCSMYAGKSVLTVALVCGDSTDMSNGYGVHASPLQTAPETVQRMRN